MLLSGSSVAQNQSENLKKYWCYRERLRQDFIVTSENVEEYGVNIPASDINLTTNEITWGDGNSGISHYLSVLSTELWLLKNNGQDYSVTLKELYYAMLAMERMDLYSENEWRKYHNKTAYINSADINGCHIRDDVSQNFWDEYSDHFKVSKFNSVYVSQQRQEISQDNIYHNIEGLALIASLVGVENVSSIPVNFVNPYINNYLTSKGIKNGNNINFSLWAKDYVERYINFMQSGGITWRLISFFGQTIASITNRWVLLNPVTGKPVREGSGLDFDTGIFYNAGVIYAGKEITGKNLRTQDAFIVSNGTANGIFKNLFTSGGQIPELKWPSPFDKVFKPIKIPSFDRYKISTLATNGDVLGDDTFSVLRSNQAKNSIQPYEHFPLFYETLHDPSRNLMLPFSLPYIQDKANIEALLNKAPQEGPTNSTYEFSSSSRCVWPERLGSSTHKIEYSGLDYMMLHNLYYIAFHVKNFNSITIPKGSDDYRNGTFVGSDIVSYNTVLSTDNLSLVATNSVKLADGFATQPGASFSARVYSDETLSNYSITSESCLHSSVVENGGNIAGKIGVENEVYQAVYQEIDPNSIVYPHITIDIEVDSSIFETSNDAARSQGLNELAIDTIYSVPSAKTIESSVDKSVWSIVTVVPNPTSGIVRFNGIEISEPVLIEVLSVNGHKMLSKVLLDNDRAIDLSELPNGVYWIRIYSRQKGFETKVIMLQKP